MVTNQKNTNQMMKNDLEQYFLWLVSLIDNRTITRGTKDFLRWLHNDEEFYSILPNDDNRTTDGIALRDFYDQNNATQVYAMLFNEKQSCSMLEFLVALSQRMDYILQDLVIYEHLYPKYFWMFINNLGLEIFQKSDLDADSKIYKNETILRTFLDRRYLANGVGGLFPLHNPHKDQRQVEIWYQMQSYIAEMQK